MAGEGGSPLGAIASFVQTAYNYFTRPDIFTPTSQFYLDNPSESPQFGASSSFEDVVSSGILDAQGSPGFAGLSPLPLPLPEQTSPAPPTAPGSSDVLPPSLPPVNPALPPLGSLDSGGPLPYGVASIGGGLGSFGKKLINRKLGRMFPKKKTGAERALHEIERGISRAIRRGIGGALGDLFRGARTVSPEKLAQIMGEELPKKLPTKYVGPRFRYLLPRILGGALGALGAGAEIAAGVLIPSSVAPGTLSKEQVKAAEKRYRDMKREALTPIKVDAKKLKLPNLPPRARAPAPPSSARAPAPPSSARAPGELEQIIVQAQRLPAPNPLTGYGTQARQVVQNAKQRAQRIRATPRSSSSLLQTLLPSLIPLGTPRARAPAVSIAAPAPIASPIAPGGAIGTAPLPLPLPYSFGRGATSSGADKCQCKKRGKARKCLERASVVYKTGRNKGKPAGTKCVRFAS